MVSEIESLQDRVQHNKIATLDDLKLEISCGNGGDIDEYNDVLEPMGWNACDRCGDLWESERLFWENYDWGPENKDLLKGAELEGKSYTALCEKCVGELVEKGKEYICVADYQNTDFHIGDTKTADEWKEWALSMNDMDECENREEFSRLPAKDAVDYVADMWQIEIVPYDNDNSEHKELRKEYQRQFEYR